jgi:hypothetical protein
LPLVQLIFLCVKTSIFSLWLGFFIYVLIKSSAFHTLTSQQVRSTSSVVLICMLFGVLLFTFILLAENVRKFGRVEVRLTKLELQSGHSLGLVRFRRKRLFKSLERLAVIGTGENDGPASLMAYFSDQKPLIVAKIFPRPMLDRLASDIVRAAARLGSGHKVSLDHADSSAASSFITPTGPGPATRTLYDLEILRTEDRLMIRGRRLAVVLSLIGVLVCGSFSLSLAYKNIVGSDGFPPLWDRPPGGDRNVAIVFIVIALLFFFVTPVALFVMYLRRHFRPWIFDRQSGKLIHGNRSWPLANLTTVLVDVRPSTGKAGVVLHLGEARTLGIAWFHGGGKGPPLSSRIPIAEDLAKTIGEFIRVPVSK